MRMILLGPPGAGKGTQAKSISNKFSIPHISTGDIFRKNISEKTPLGIEAKKHIDKGHLVPDKLTIDIIKDRLNNEDCKNGFLLDGYPRTVNQGEALKALLEEDGNSLDIASLIKVPRKFILSRMTGRRVCLSCGASYHITFNPPKVAGKCDVCGCDLVQRADDTEDTVNERINIYEAQTLPLIKYYDDKNLLSAVDGTLEINEVFESICGILESIKK
jgi:adenylate kinase